MTARLGTLMIIKNCTHVIRISILLCCGVLLSGCFPLMGHYYEPTAGEGTPTKQDCRGRAGPMTDMEVERSSVKILVIPHQRSSLRSLTLLFTSRDAHISVRWSDFKILDTSGNSVPIELNGEDTFIGSNEVEVGFSGDAPDEFVLVIPPMTVDGVDYPATNVTFKRQFVWWVQFLNC